MHSVLKALVVDDEENARRLLTKLLKDLKSFREIRTAWSYASAMAELETFDPDVIFLDIRMPGKNGFSFISDLPQNRRPEIVIVTAYDQYAIKAVKEHAFDYLLKPVNRKELKQSVEQLILRKSGLPDASAAKKESQVKIRIRLRGETIFVNTSSILFCRAAGNYTMVYTGDKEHLCSMNIGKVEELLPDSFRRVGRSYILNTGCISVINRKESTILLEHNGYSATVSVSRHHIKELDSM